MEIELKVDQSIPTPDMNTTLRNLKKDWSANTMTSQYYSDNTSPATPPAAAHLPASFPGPDSSPSPVADSEFEGLEHHRRIFSDGDFQLAGDGVNISGEPFVGSTTGGLDEMWTEDELQAAFFDLDKLGPLENDGDDGGCAGTASLMDHDDGDIGAGESEKRYVFNVKNNKSVKGLVEVITEPKKAMRHGKWAQMWAVEPQRFKRIMATKQYAARTKERKTRELLELRQQIHCLQSEAKSLSLQLTMYQRDVSSLSAENAELKIRLKVMEQQAHLRDALNEAMKQETERLKNSTRMMRVPSESFGLEARGNMYSPLASLSTLPMQQNLLLSPTTQSAAQQQRQAWQDG